MATATGERADLIETLDKHRGFLIYTARELSDEQASRRTTASELTVGGLIKHVTEVERNWVKFVNEGPQAMGGGGNWDDEATVQAYLNGFRMLPGETLAGLIGDYQDQARHTNEVVAEVDLDSIQPLPEAPWRKPGESWSARRVFLHIIAETSQHAGHADIIRESLDGAKTMG